MSAWCRRRRGFRRSVPVSARPANSSSQPSTAAFMPSLCRRWVLPERVCGTGEAANAGTVKGPGTVFPWRALNRAPAVRHGTMERRAPGAGSAEVDLANGARRRIRGSMGWPADAGVMTGLGHGGRGGAGGSEDRSTAGAERRQPGRKEAMRVTRCRRERRGVSAVAGGRQGGNGRDR